MDEEKLVRKLVGKKKMIQMEAMVKRLDRLTQDEARQTATQIFEVVRGLVRNMNAVMDGAEDRQAQGSLPIDGKVSVDQLTGTFGMYTWPQSSNRVSD
jgi:hypothetical protein